MHLVDQRLGNGNAEELLKGPRRLSDQHLQAVDSLEAEAARLAEKRGFERRIYPVEYNGVAVHRSRGKRERRLSGHPKRACVAPYVHTLQRGVGDRLNGSRYSHCVPPIGRAACRESVCKYA